MIDRWLLAALHLVALVVGSTAIWCRARALHTMDAGRAGALGRALAADAAWGLAALLWIGTGLARAQGPYEKGPAYYWQNELFWAKMALLALILLLELWPGVTLLRWRVAAWRGRPIDARPARWMARTSYAQVLLVALMVLCASAMARGLGATMAGR